jgi:hypothetical protein
MILYINFVVPPDLYIFLRMLMSRLQNLQRMTRLAVPLEPFMSYSSYITRFSVKKNDSVSCLGFYLLVKGNPGFIYFMTACTFQLFSHLIFFLYFITFLHLYLEMPFVILDRCKVSNILKFCLQI